MKAINDNGTIKVFDSVPKSWGKKIGLQYASDSELEAIGFYDVNKPTTKKSQELGNIEWDADNSRFTYPVNNKTYSESLSELKEAKISEVKNIYNRVLQATDWYIIRESEGGTATPQEILTARSNYRAECVAKEAEVNALTTKAAVINYELPNY